MLTRAEYVLQEAVRFADEAEIPSDALSVSEDVILTATGLYKPFKIHSSVADKKAEIYNDFVTSENIVVTQQILELLLHKLHPDRHPLEFSFGSAFLRRPEMIRRGDYSPNKVPEPVPFCESNERLRKCRRKTMGLLNRDNVYVPINYQVNIPERWRILQKQEPLMVEDALRLVNRGATCNTHAQYLVESHSRNLPVLSLNINEVIPAAESLGIKTRRTLYGGDLIYSVCRPQ